MSTAPPTASTDNRITVQAAGVMILSALTMRFR